MLDSMLKLIDKLIELARIGKKREKARLDEVFSPAFDEMQAVHADYLAMFAELAIRIGKIPHGAGYADPVARETVDFLAQRRLLQRPVREKLRVLRDLAASDGFTDHEKAFLGALDHYFLYASVTASRGTSMSMEILNQLKVALGMALSAEDREAGGAGLSRGGLEHVVRQCQRRCDHLEGCWRALAVAHADLKLHVIAQSA